MVLEQVIPLTTIEGHKYLIQLSPFDLIAYPIEITIDIVNIVILLVDEIENQPINNASTLFQMAKIIQKYLDINNVVLYCYCDNKIIKRNKNKLHLLPQDYRSQLFSSLFSKNNALKEYLNEVIYIPDEKNGDHYIHLISRIENKYHIDAIATELDKFNDKG